MMRRNHEIVWKDFLNYKTLKEKLNDLGYPELDNVKIVWQTWYRKYSEKDIPPGDEVWFRLRSLDIDPVEDRDRILIIKNCEDSYRDCVSYLKTILNRETIGLVDPDEDYRELIESIRLLSKEELRRTSLPGRPQYAIVFSERGLTFIGPSATQTIDTLVKSPDKISKAFQEKLKNLARSLSRPEKYVVVSIDKLADKSVAKNYFPKVWQEIFDRRDIIEEFFQLFKLARDYMYRELQGITDDTEKRQFVDELMLQLLIVWYLQSKGFLPEGNEQPYLIKKFLEVKDQGEYSYFEFLKRLFNVMMGNVEDCKLGDDGAFAECPDLGRVFITGPAPFLTSLEKIEQVRIPNKVFYFFTEDGIKQGLNYLITVNPMRSRGNKNLLESMLQEELNEGGVPVLAIFESRDWTVEGVEGEIDRYVIGAIFEKLLDPEARKGQGAYYTPEEITKYIAENTIKPYLVDKLNHEFKTEYQTLDEFFNEELEKTNRDLKEKQYEFLFNELRNLKILDPAVGSGHFLESAIEVLVDIYKQIRNAVLDYSFDESKFTITTADKKGGLVNIPITKLRAGDEFNLKIMFYVIISRNIYGVDIDPRAVSLARARLFLTLAESFDPSGVYIRFPNVHFNIRPGNSLIGFTTIEELQTLLTKEEKNKLDRWLTFNKRSSGKGPSRVNLSLSADTKEYIESIEEKLNPTQDRSIDDELKKLKVNLNTQLTEDLMRRFLRLKSRLAEILLVSLDTKYAQEIIRLLEEMTGAVNDNLNHEFAESLVKILREKGGKKSKITSDQLKELLDDLSKVGSFHWPWEFPEVFLRESPGFDVVIGNPPYGNILDDIELKIISFDPGYRWKTFKRDKARKGSKNAATIFVERSYSLIRENGRFGMILPNSIERIPEFAKIRSALLNEVRVYEIVDEGFPFSGANLEMATIFYVKQKLNRNYPVRCISRKINGEWIFEKYKAQELGYFPLYYDEVYDYILSLSDIQFGGIKAIQGRPRKADYIQGQGIRCISAKVIDPYLLKLDKDTHRIVSPTFNYIDSEYEKQLLITPYFFGTDLESLKKNVLEVAIKPTGFITDGTAILLIPLKAEYFFYYQILLNSKLCNYVVKRYILNYSIRDITIRDSTISRIPIRHPKDSGVFTILATYLNFYFQVSYKKPQQTVPVEGTLLKKLCDSLIYELYFKEKFYQDGLYPQPEEYLLQAVSKHLKAINYDRWAELYWKKQIEGQLTVSEEKELMELEKENMKTIEKVYKRLKEDKEIVSWIEKIKSHEWVKRIENGF
ncbi:hypothetical protein GQS_07780 [Thermococcus sp. 4557]|uniref:Eco57I restriction-modification methylase domain-containing protein n=1 Tax=Thermococcus sp. (strain CGMCC 1.5172 / 4557) TaxID=1042877 RepID=UPI000219EC9D|nr:hypothetical protein GQS_07780 [Thermococcus sp. 4557]